MKKIILLITIVSVLFVLSGCIGRCSNERFEKTGIVYKIEYDYPVGGTYSDWMHFVYFKDGTVFACRRTDIINLIELNRTGIYKIQERFYDNDGNCDEYHEIISVTYLDI